MQRHRNHQHLARRLIRKLRNRRGQHPAQPLCRPMQPVVFERVDRRPHPAIVGPIRHCPLEWRRCHPATPAESQVGPPGRHPPIQRIAAARTQLSALNRKLGPANFANWHGSELRQWVAAEGTAGRKQGATDGVHGTSQDAGDGPPARSLRGWNVERQRTGVPAEDAPHLRLAQLLARRLAVSILGARRRFHEFCA